MGTSYWPVGCVQVYGIRTVAIWLLYILVWDFIILDWFAFLYKSCAVSCERYFGVAFDSWWFAIIIICVDPFGHMSLGEVSLGHFYVIGTLGTLECGVFYSHGFAWGHDPSRDFFASMGGYYDCVGGFSLNIYLYPMGFDMFFISLHTPCSLLFGET